jgi:hypothetical protein
MAHGMKALCNVNAAIAAEQCSLFLPVFNIKQGTGQVS